MVRHLLGILALATRATSPFSNAYEWPLCCTALGARAIWELHALWAAPTKRKSVVIPPRRHKELKNDF
jgi:hypothetical protein